MTHLINVAIDYGLFLLEVATIVMAIGLVIGWLVSAAGELRARKQETLKVTNVNERLESMADRMSDTLLNASEKKARRKQKKSEAKQRQKAEKLGRKHEPNRLFVLDFDGDIKASPVESLRESINALLQVAESGDEVLVRLESGGGMVHSYGLAASQLVRLREAGMHLTVAVDRVAASGGYLMACVAERIVAAPFAIVGSIGVVAQLPNFHRFLKDKDIDFDVYTAGEHKRTLTMFGENTESGRAKFVEELEDVHGLFKSFVGDYRPSLDIDAVSTGEHWHGTQALSMNLVDEIGTSDDVMLTAARNERSVYTVDSHERGSVWQRITGEAGRLMSRLAAGGAVGVDARRPS
ncbi:protease SohB [Salinisphaera sp. USBA-960]|nr:protease SohB [Salifodinibacter halophilus]NNC26976.1 protease SohB [Salifodinibacter halophilus]